MCEVRWGVILSTHLMLRWREINGKGRGENTAVLFCANLWCDIKEGNRVTKSF